MSEEMGTCHTLHRLISDPFYCGYIIWNGEEYEGKHKKIISESLFNEVQDKLKRKYKAGQLKKHYHVFKGLVKCAECGCLVSWETQKNHNYGRCKGFKPCIRTGYIRQEVIEEKLDDLMKKIKPKDEVVLDWINRALKEKHQDKKDYSQNTRESLNLALKKMENRLDRIYEDKLDEIISVEYYKMKFKEFSKKKKEILEEMGKLEKRVDNYYEIGMEIHELAFTALEKYHSTKATFDDKRILVNRIFRDLELNSDKTLNVKYTPAFEFLSEWIPKLNATSELLKKSSFYRKTGTLVPAHPILLAYSDAFRTFLIMNNTFSDV